MDWVFIRGTLMPTMDLRGPLAGCSRMISGWKALEDDEIVTELRNLVNNRSPILVHSRYT
jgi:hypothetical protein